MPKRKKRTATTRKKKDEKDEGLDVSESDSLDRPPSAKKVAPASSTCQLEDDIDQISSFTSVPLLNSTINKSEGGEDAALSSHFWCNYCEFSADTKKELVTHMRQHMIKCSYCPFSSLSRNEVVRHCKYEHDKDLEVASSTVTQEVDSSSIDCDMDKDPCSACMFCDFMTYSTEHLEKHTASKHPGMIPKSVAKMITKQVSAQVRRDDALFYLTISNDKIAASGCAQDSTSKSNSDSSKVESSSFIDLNTIDEKADDVKPEIKPSKTVLEDMKTEKKPESPIKEQLAKDIISDILLQPREKSARDESSDKEASSTTSKADRKVKVETMYCLTCPYSNVYVEKIKCHTLVQHPLGAAVATYSNMKDDSSSQDITFFCVREDCSHSGAEWSAYQKHLMECSHIETLTVLEKERLKSTLTFILDHQKKHSLKSEIGFLDFASSYLGLPLSESNDSFLDRGDRESSSHSSQTSETTPAKAITPQLNQNYQVQSDFQPNQQISGQSSQTYTDTQMTQKSNANLHNEGSAIETSRNNQFHMNSGGSNMLWSQPSNQTNQASSDQKSIPDYGQSAPGFNALSLQSSVQLNDSQQPAFNHHMSQGSINSNSFTGNPNNYNANSHSIVQSSQEQSLMMPATPNNSYALTSVDQSLNSSHNFGTFTSQTSSYQNRFDASFSDKTVGASTTYTNSIGEQHPVSDTINTTSTHVSDPEKISQPRMMNLISDSYSVLLSDGGGSGLQDFSTTAESPQQPTLTPLISCQQYFVESQQLVSENVNNTQTHLTMQNQSLLSSSLVAQPSLDNPVGLQHSAQAVELLQHNSVSIVGEDQFPSVPSSSQQSTISNIYNSNPNFQNAQTSSSFGALRNALGPEPTAPSVKAPSVPNFLVTSSLQTQDQFSAQQTSVTAQSFLNPGTSPMQAMQTMADIPATPPQNTIPRNPNPGASPLSPSIYLSGKAPSHRRTNWTATDKTQRGMSLPAIRQRGGLAHMPTQPYQNQQASTAQIPQGHNVRQRLFSPVPTSTRGRGRGYARQPRMSAGRVRMPQSRMPANSNADDDDVIVTAVVRGPQQQQMQPRQPLSGRYPGRGGGGAGPVARGQRQAPHFQGRGRDQFPGSRYPPPIHPSSQPPKQFDISKHFEDLACVVNSNEEGGVDGKDNDEIQIVSVTPGKDKEKNQPKAVNASMFSFCCVHCGKDQGSKKVMKQHMKARHNDSLLGAFTNRETGQLLFFCPNLTCEFMTYDERRLSEHLHKCFDLDKSKPFDFGTAIKNLKSMKIRQMDVRTTGRSHDNPIDLDGQGMKDSFSTSLNAAFDEIVENTSGRQIVRPATPPRAQPQVQPPIPTQSFQPHRGAIRGPIRHPYQSSPGIGQRFSGFRDQRLRASSPYRQSRGNVRPAGVSPRHPRMEMRNIRGMNPRMRAYNAGSHMAGPQPQFSAPQPPQFSTPPRMPMGGQQEPIVIDLDADSPEGPVERKQDSSIVGHPPHGNTVLPEQNLNVRQSSLPGDSTNTPSVTTFNNSSSQYMSTTTFCTENSANSDLAQTDIGSVSSEYMANRDKPDPQLQKSDSDMLGTNSSNQSDTSCNSGQPAVSEGSSFNQMTPEYENQPKPMTPSEETVATPNTDSKAASRSIVSELLRNSIQVRAESDSKVLPPASVADTPGMSSDACSVISSAISNAPSTSALSLSDPTTATLSSSAAATPSTALDNFDEEEKINAIVLEKVFAKVPNMPKNLSRRLVSKFKQYANYRGVKITPDSKVIDEFVSKISYKGSNTDKEATKVAQNQQLVSSATSEPKPATSRLESEEANSHALTNTSEVRKETDTSKVQEERGASGVQEDTGTSEAQGDSGSSEVQKDSVEEETGTSEDREETELQAHTEASSEGSDNDKGKEKTTNSVIRTVPSPEVIAKQVILAQRQLQFSGAFASIAMKASIAGTEPTESNSNNSSTSPVKGKQQTFHSDIEQNLSSPDSAVTDANAFASQRGLLDHSARSKSVDISNNSPAGCTIKRSSSFPLAISHTIKQTSCVSPTTKCLSASDNSSTPGSYGQHTNVSPPLQLPTSLNNNNGSTFSSLSGDNGDTQVYIPSIENVLQHHSPLLGKDIFMQNDLPAPFSTASEPAKHSQSDSVASPPAAVELERENYLETDKDSLTPEQVASSSTVAEFVDSNQIIPAHVPNVDSRIKEFSPLSSLEPKEILDKDAVTPDVGAVCKDVIDDDELATRTPSVPECENQSSAEEDHSTHMMTETSNTSSQLKPEVDSHPMTRKDSTEEKKPLTPDLPAPDPEELPSMIKPDVENTVSFPKQEPITIDSSVEHLVTGHEGLEVDIAGTPVENCLLPTKQEASVEEDIKTTEAIQALSEMIYKDDVASVLEEKKISKKNGRPNLEMVDPTSGKLIFKVKKRRLSKKQSSKDEEEEEDETKEKEEKEEDPGEIKEEDEGGLFVRRSERKRKPVHGDYRSVDTNEIDELMSDDDDEYNIDNDDDDYDTDSETEKRDESGLPLKKKAKKIKPPPDPTAFDLSTKGSFKCWLCKKIFSKCTFAKAHIIKKHIQGLCAIDVGQSEETGSVRLLVFCPRECRYATLDLEGLQRHSDSCEKPLLKENGEEYLTVNKEFLANKYSQLLETPLKTLLEPPKSTPSSEKSGKPKKVKTSTKSGATKPSEMATVIIAHSEALDPDCAVVPDTADQSEHLSGSAPCHDRSEPSGIQAFVEASVSNSNTDTVNSVTFTNVRPEQQGEYSSIANNNFQPSFHTSSSSFPQPQHPTIQQHQTAVQQPYHRVSEFQRHKMSQGGQITHSQQHQQQMFQQEQGPQQTFYQHQTKAPQHLTPQQQFESRATRPPFATQNVRQSRNAPQAVRQPYPQQRHLTTHNIHANVRGRPPLVRGNSVQMQHRRPSMNPSQPSMNPSQPRPRSSNVPLRHPQYRMSSQHQSFAGGSTRHQNTNIAQINNSQRTRSYQSDGNMSTGLPVNTTRNQPRQSFVSNQPLTHFNNNQISQNMAQPYGRANLDEDVIMVDESGTICLD